SSLGVRTRDWYNVGSGDGFFTVLRPDDPDLMFAESQGGFLTRVDRSTMERAFVRPEPMPREDPDGEERELRWNWNTPVLMSAHDPSTVYLGSNVLFRTRDMGQSWEEISPDLTYAADRDTLVLMGVAGSEPQMSLNDGQSSYGNLTALAESPLDADVLWTGSDDGRVHVTRDGGATWTDVTDAVDGLPPRTYVTRIVASNGASGTAFVAFDGHRSDDFGPYLYRTDDYGQSWRPRVNGLPESSLNALAQHPRRADLLFTGNELGVYVSLDGGGEWVRLENGLPTVPVDDIVIHRRDNDLVLGTHGRGIWIMDDIGPLEELDADVLASDVQLFDVRRATSYNAHRPQGWTPGIWEAETPPMGSRIRYWLGDSTDSVRIEISDPTGGVIRELDAPGEAGLNEVIWDLRMAEKDRNGEWMDPGPRVLPGEYTVRLHAAGTALETGATVRLDPRTDISRADLMARQEAMLDSYRLSASAAEARAALDTLRTRLGDAEDVLDRAGNPPGSLTDRVGAMDERLDALRDDLGDASDGASVWFRIQNVTAPPTADALRAIDRSWEDLPEVVADLNAVLGEAMPALLADVYQPGATPPAMRPVTAPRRER
ncbi:MAG: hypothetical protein PVI57_03260, partial [Gemmatimonadota bacterium]